MDNALTRAEHIEFAKRMEDEHARQNKRIGDLEKASEKNGKLLASIERIATSVENMQKEIASQGDRLGRLEARDGEMWRKIIGHIATTVLGAIILFIFQQIGM